MVEGSTITRAPGDVDQHHLRCPVTYATSTTANVVDVTSISGPAMMIIVANGMVTSRVITAEQAVRIASVIR